MRWALTGGLLAPSLQRGAPSFQLDVLTCVERAGIADATGGWPRRTSHSRGREQVHRPPKATFSPPPPSPSPIPHPHTS
ncbi:unnamed protein product, partial [Iphiclides podalirius]